MTRLEILTDLLSKKVERQTVLKERNEDLLQLETELEEARAGRWFGNGYHSVKRFMLLSAGVFFMLGFALLTAFPRVLTQEDSPLYTTIREGLLEDVHSMAGINLYQVNEKYFNEAVESKVNEFKDDIRIFFLILGLGFLYMARLVKKVIKRNKKIAEAEELTEHIIDEFQLTIEEEEKELVVLNDLVRKNMNFNHVNS